MSLVFDTSAMLALLRNEPGADFVQDLLDEADVEKFAHTVNFCEVFYQVAWRADVLTARESLTLLRAAGIEERADIDTALWQDAATLIADRRRELRPLALGDAFGVALARRLDADFVTADRNELAPLQAAGVVRVLFIR